MEQIAGTFRLLEALKAEGFSMPEECREARLVMGVDCALVIEFDVYVTNENLVKLGRALQRLAKLNEETYDDSTPRPPRPRRPA
jgi:hypothetical protein